MSQENVELARAAYEAWNARDTEGFRRVFADDAEFRTSGLFPDLDAVYRGPDEILRFYEELLSAWEYFRMDVRDIEDRGDWLVVSVRFLGRGRSSGVEVELDFHHAIRLANGQCTHFVAGMSAEQALKAAGLSA